METLNTIYTVCAVIGGTLLVCQFLLSFLGLGDHHDVGGHDFDAHPHDFHGHDHEVSHDHETSWFVGVLTFRTVVAALAFFGLAGLAGAAKDWEPALTLLVALAAGGGAMFLVAYVMRSMRSLHAEGTVRIDRAIGEQGTVYLPIPGKKAGLGKVHLSLQNRTVEYQALTPEDGLPAGTKVKVVGILGPDTVEVVPATTSERITHV
jgi:membrane protein implicated in regulation of membrane protease activity